MSREKRSVLELAKKLDNSGVEKSSLVYANAYCLGLKVKTRRVESLLPCLCEHSDVVCIGSSYPELAAEHGQLLIKGDALKILSSQDFNSSGHIL